MKTSLEFNTIPLFISRREWRAIIMNSVTCDAAPGAIKETNNKEFKGISLQVKKKSKLKSLFVVLGLICIGVLLLICFGLIILGMLSFGYENYTTIDISNYGIFEGHVKGEKEDLRSGLYIFPNEISENAKDIKFLYSCLSIGFGVDYQQFLECTYSNEEYQAEINRLENIECKINTKKGTVVNRIEYSDTKFCNPAYITAYGGMRVFEYALCNEDTKTITYIFLQLISNEKVAFNKKYLPVEYQGGKQLLDEKNLSNSNIYYCYLGNGVYQSFKE